MKAWVRKQKLACAELILRIEPDQLPHTRFDDPKDIWENLKKVHCARGLATRLSLRRRFLSMSKDESKSMRTWIAKVRHLAHELTENGTEVTDDDIIIALTLGLPPAYDNFIVTLDATPDGELTLDLVIAHLLNEESHQHMTSSIEEGAALYAGRKDQKLNVTCHQCGKRGHRKANCWKDDSESDSESDSHKMKTTHAKTADAGADFVI